MTRLPLDDRSVKGVEGPEVEANLLCAAPGCINQATERHHIWRRSFLAGAYDWVLLPSGFKVANVLSFCHDHHQALTVNAAWLTWDEPAFGFDWNDMLNGARPLQVQPTIDGNGHTSTPDHFEGNFAANIAGERVEHSGVCPGCLRPLPRPKEEKKEDKRPRRTWSITVPKDHREDGAETLDVLLEAAREEMARAGLPYGETDSVRFFVLSAALGLFVQHAQEVLA